MGADGGFDGGAAPDAATSGWEFVDRVATLAASDPQGAVELISEIVEEANAIARYASIRLRRAAGSVPGAPSEPVSLAMVAPAQAYGEADDLGRNQKSRVREAVVLDIIQGNAGPCALSKLMSGLAARRIVVGQPAVVSHLHRLKLAGLITQPGNGFYDITSDGLGHLRKLRASLGSLVP